jgi:hypothetical protein
MAMNKKQLINVTQQHKDWIFKVIAVAAKKGEERNQTDVIRAIFNRAMAQDPSTFADEMAKIELRARLEDLERRKAAMRAEEEALVKELENPKLVEEGDLVSVGKDGGKHANR